MALARAGSPTGLHDTAWLPPANLQTPITVLFWYSAATTKMKPQLLEHLASWSPYSYCQCKANALVSVWTILSCKISVWTSLSCTFSRIKRLQNGKLWPESEVIFTNWEITQNGFYPSISVVARLFLLLARDIKVWTGRVTWRESNQNLTARGRTNYDLTRWHTRSRLLLKEMVNLVSIYRDGWIF